LPEKFVGRETVQLNGPTSWTVAKLTLADGATIVTNGHPLTIVVTGDLVVDGTATITSFPAADRGLNRQVPHKAGRGADGASHDRGMGSDGPGVNGNRGADGGHGGAGAAGTNGNKGRDAGVVTIVVSGTATGRLLVVNTGMDGQPGGEGGDGGRGGNGQQGGRGVTKRGPLGIPAGAEKGPGFGGNGGSGGPGGTGGRGGDAGNGGNWSFTVLGSKDGLSVQIDLRAGSPGPGGRGGAGGPGGEFGWGGRGNVMVHGREEERKGASGASGAAGAPGPAGSPGCDGRFEGNVQARLSK
jgi:hypothetical protein